MKQLTCEMCGGTDLIKQDGAFVCQNCGMKYSVEEAKKMMIEGTVDVQGTVKVDNSAFVERYLQNARRAKQKEDWPETEKYYNMVEQNDPTNIEAIFYSAFARIKSALLEAETAEKRRGVFNILTKSVSVIDDNFDNTNEEHHKLLSEIMDDIKGLKRGTIVPTTHLQEYVTKNGYGNIVGRNQIVENDSLYTTYNMIDKVFEAYMESLANIIVEHSPESTKKLFMEYVKEIPTYSEIHEKVAAHIDGYKTPQQASEEIAKQVKVDELTTRQNINAQINELAKTICPIYMSGETLVDTLSAKVIGELKKLHPNSEALKANTSSGCCYVATAVYGSYDCPEVWTLRRYRDYTLAETWYGRAFIKTYYAISPTLVKWFGHTEWFKNMWKGKLDRMVSKLQANGVESTPYEDKNWQSK
ncbi:MAG: hypothetical protein IJO09_03135 [Oscillospiraceae bacterium]|nr:hypothetical protein [Oscillospiraceae bacterium]